MTKEEEEELKRLEANLFLVVKKISDQQKIILELRKELQDSKKEIEDLRNKNSQLEKDYLLASTFGSISPNIDSNKLESFLNDMIKKIDVCIEQIEAI